MNIGIIVYSLSGHTLGVVTSLQQKLAAGGHAVALQRLEMVGPATPSAEKGAELKSRPALGEYDALVLACPVRGGAPPPPMASYLQGVPSLQGKKVALLVTHFFPRAWGARQTLTALQEACAARGATVCGMSSVHWFGLGRRRQVARVVDELAGCFQMSD